jgi:hypothetical protein
LTKLRESRIWTGIFQKKRSGLIIQVAGGAWNPAKPSMAGHFNQYIRL